MRELVAVQAEVADLERDPEVDDLQGAGLGLEEEVVRLHVVVQDPGLVHGAHDLQHLLRNRGEVLVEHVGPHQVQALAKVPGNDHEHRAKGNGSNRLDGVLRAACENLVREAKLTPQLLPVSYNLMLEVLLL